MKKAIFGLAAVGAVIVLRKRIGLKMREHCQQMAAKCKQMMAAQGEGRGEAAGMPEHCKQMMGHSEAQAETAEPAEPVAA